MTDMEINKGAQSDFHCSSYIGNWIRILMLINSRRPTAECFTYVRT